MLDVLSSSAGRVGLALAQWQRDGRVAGHRVGSQFKAEVDARAHEMWAGELAALAPDVPVVSEEDPGSHGLDRSRTHWIIDPLDGTASFVEGFAGWVTQVALMENGKPVIAVVFAPMTNELFHAERGRGAWRNGRRLQRTLTMCALIDNYPAPRGVAMDAMTRFQLTRYVESGSLGLKICRVADGTADLFVKDVVVRSWDIAPAELILQEAGGAIATLKGEDFAYERRTSHQGLIAAPTTQLTREVAAWAATRSDRHREALRV